MSHAGGRRIAVLSLGLSASGGDLVLARLTEALVAGGARVEWLSPAGGQSTDGLIPTSIEVIPVGLQSRWLAPLEMARRSRRYDLVIAASPLLALIARIVPGMRTRVVWFHQGWATAVGRSRATVVLIRLAELILRKWKMRTVVVSESLRQELPHATLLRNGVDLQKFTPRPLREHVQIVGSILSGGKLHLLPDLAAVHREIQGAYPEMEFRVLTPEPVEFGNGRTVDGRRQPPWAFLQECDVFVSASRADGFALPPLEAMACGVPVVAVPTSGLLAYARDGENALLAPEGRPDQIARLVMSLVSDGGLRSRLREAGLATASRYPLASAEEAYRAYFLGNGCGASSTESDYAGRTSSLA